MIIILDMYARSNAALTMLRATHNYVLSKLESARYSCLEYLCALQNLKLKSAHYSCLEYLCALQSLKLESAHYSCLEYLCALQSLKLLKCLLQLSGVSSTPKKGTYTHPHHHAYCLAIPTSKFPCQVRGYSKVGSTDQLAIPMTSPAHDLIGQPQPTMGCNSQYCSSPITAYLNLR